MSIRESARAEPATLRSVLVVDVDIHINDIPAALAPYCDMPWRRSLEHLAGGGPYGYLDVPGYAPALVLDPPFPGGRQVRTVDTAVQMRRELDDLAIDAGILFPDHLLLLAQLPNDDYAGALARAYNRWMADEWLDERGMFGAIVAAPQDPRNAAEEIRRYASNDKVVAVYLPTSAVHPLWGHRCYDPIYSAAQDAGLPVMLHSVTAISPRFPFNVEQFETGVARHVVGHNFAMMANMVDIVTTGVPARFPQVDIVFTEAGIAWVPFMMWKLDKEYNELRRDLPELNDRPSSYIRKMYFATQPIEEPDSPEHLRQIIDMIGEDQILFASDWPHHDFDHPRAVFDLPFALESRKKILGGNAARLFGFDAELG